MDAQKELLDVIEILIEEKIREKVPQIYVGICQSILKNNTAQMIVNGDTLNVQYYGNTPKVGNTYRIFIPNSNTSMAFIISGGDSGDVPTSSDYNQLTNKPEINGVVLNGNQTSADLKIKEDKTYIYTQATASAEWSIAHNLDKYPAISIIDTGGNIVVGDVTYIDTDHVTVKFNAAFAGKVYLN